MLTYNMVLAAAAQAGDSLAAEQWFNKMTEEQPPFFLAAPKGESENLKGICYKIGTVNWVCLVGSFFLSIVLWKNMDILRFSKRNILLFGGFWIPGIMRLMVQV